MRPLILALLAVAALTAATASPAAAADCRGTVTKSVNGNQIRAHDIATRNIGCETGKRVIRRFLGKADRKPSCNRRSKRPAPTSGCQIGEFNCFRAGSTYCASPSAKEVSWRE